MNKNYLTFCYEYGEKICKGFSVVVSFISSRILIYQDKCVVSILGSQSVAQQGMGYYYHPFTISDNLTWFNSNITQDMDSPFLVGFYLHYNPYSHFDVEAIIRLYSHTKVPVFYPSVYPSPVLSPFNKPVTIRFSLFSLSLSLSLFWAFVRFDRFCLSGRYALVPLYYQDPNNDCLK